jgi:hypothetical protein
MNTPERSSGVSPGAVRNWLKAEGLSVLALSVLLYSRSGASCWIFAGLLLTPYLAMLAYLLSPRAGSIAYNLVHSYLLPLGLATIAIAVRRVGMLPFLCIWTAHIGMDRLLGYGLKFPTAFAETHLGRVGRGEARMVETTGNER